MDTEHKYFAICQGSAVHLAIFRKSSLALRGRGQALRGIRFLVAPASGAETA